MTARDEAARAIAYEVDGSMYAALVAVDAIPTDVLARLAIERGALEDTGFAQNRLGAVYACSTEWNPDNYGHARLYRLVES